MFFQRKNVITLGKGDFITAGLQGTRRVDHKSKNEVALSSAVQVQYTASVGSRCSCETSNLRLQLLVLEKCSVI
jgi:hypothetical protein